MIKIACDKKGTHSLQAIVSLISRDVEDRLIKETLDGHVLDLTLVLPFYYRIIRMILGCSRHSSYSETHCRNLS